MECNYQRISLGVRVLVGLPLEVTKFDFPDNFVSKNS